MAQDKPFPASIMERLARPEVTTDKRHRPSGRGGEWPSVKSHLGSKVPWGLCVGAVAGQGAEWGPGAV